ncbi:hypothetical protein NIIg32_gp60 [Parageobacillus phage vB_PtoS_NIIg3.2]|nr:hypothetical protein NIIg32_gp60 [Parageobacillus phage vB_PtoS_NIIg3.2]
MKQLELDLSVPIDESKLDPNPMVREYGYGPKDKKCKHCQYLFYKQFSKKYWKCALRPNTNGPATDHRVNWKACRQFLDSERR